MCKLPIKGHQGAAGRGKCKSYNNSNKQSFIETTAVTNAIQRLSDDRLTPPPPSPPSSETVFQDPERCRKLPSTSAPSLLQELDEISLTIGFAQGSSSQPVENIKTSCTEEVTKNPPKKKLKSKKAKTSGFDYFLPMQEWQNVYSKFNLVEHLNMNNKKGSSSSQSLAGEEVGRVPKVTADSTLNLPSGDTAVAVGGGSQSKLGGGSQSDSGGGSQLASTGLVMGQRGSKSDDSNGTTFDRGSITSAGSVICGTSQLAAITGSVFERDSITPRPDFDEEVDAVVVAGAVTGGEARGTGQVIGGESNPSAGSETSLNQGTNPVANVIDDKDNRSAHGRRPIKKCKFYNCLFCEASKCLQCKNCLNTKLKAKCVKR